MVAYQKHAGMKYTRLGQKLGKRSGVKNFFSCNIKYRSVLKCYYKRIEIKIKLILKEKNLIPSAFQEENCRIFLPT